MEPKLVAAIHVPKLKQLTTQRAGHTVPSHNAVSLTYTLVWFTYFITNNFHSFYIILHLVKTVMYPFYHFTDSGYKSKPNTYCEDSGKIAEYSTLSLAQQSCSADDQCKVVTDYQCNGGFWTCTDPNLLDSSSGSCSWLKGICKLYIFILEFSYFN